MTTFGLPRRRLDVCPSTNDLARAWARDPTDPAPHGALVTADFQTQGRGRRGRRWEAAPAQSALMSFVLRPDGPLADAWQIGFLAALAAAEALRGLGLDARLKWPNDVLLQGAKSAGVLVEVVSLARPRAQGRYAAIAGIGVNVNQEGFDADDYAYPPTSLRRVTGREHDIEAVIQAVADRFGHWDAVYRSDGFAPVLAGWRASLAVGAIVRHGPLTARLLGLSDTGQARVQLPDGTFADWATVEG